MAIKDYYAILGVSRTETPAGIRSAYREAARRSHPDLAGVQGATEFRDIVEAHSVLSDPERRRQYDETLGLRHREQTRGEFDRFGTGWEPVSISVNTQPMHPSFNTLPDRLLHNLTCSGVANAENVNALSIEVTLTPEEAAGGGLLSVGIPVDEICRACDGSGKQWPFLCRPCRGHGVTYEMRPIAVHIPQVLSLGLTQEVSWEALRVNNLFVKLRLRIAGE